MSSFNSLFRKLFRLGPQIPQKPFNHNRNPFKAKKPWPPDMSKMSHTYQFRLEKKYKKRLAMKWLKPGWMKWTRIAQIGVPTAVLIYGVLFMDFSNDPLNRGGEQPFQWIRGKFWGALDNIWTPAPERHTQFKTANLKEAPSK
ncbi:hypothetical protein GQ43DRAFT_386269 [Delitschia confertaspora ATCC 74209]|uniref:Uncharacterized protein n=1 Tax=Delitschia confertaspora ATCC 74209 TaxID=1513339 RepID=A0A9P4JX88_9PLEO|nr:hypothetical protein GQ43DRAFT_386269 [Delitschia confertaspora ATCC 74209]